MDEGSSPSAPGSERKQLFGPTIRKMKKAAPFRAGIKRRRLQRAPAPLPEIEKAALVKKENKNDENKKRMKKKSFWISSKYEEF